MALARLTKQCRECPFVETCEHKEMEALGYLPEPIMADAKYKDELEKILYKDLYSHLGLQIGG